MPFIDAKIVDGKPECSRCGQKWPERIDDYGVVKGVGFWFAFRCDRCSTKRRKIFVRWTTDNDFKIKGGEVEDVKESKTEGDTFERFGD